MKIFDYINDILYKKSGSLFKKKDDESEFQPYMIQRWVSMYSSAQVRLLNGTTNKLYQSLENKSQWYKLFLTTVPRSKYKRLRYIKKVPKAEKKKSDMDIAIELVASTKELSKREVKLYVEEYGLDLESLRKRLKEK